MVIAMTGGRTLDPRRDQAILDAAREVFARKGFTGASMDQIARSAKVGKDTLYRRWSSKEALATETLAVLAARGVRSPDLDGDPHFALFLMLQDIVRVNRHSDFGPIVAGIIGEAVRNERLAEAFHRFWSERRALLGEVVDRIIGNATPAERERVIDQLVGPIYYRLLLTGDGPTDEYLWDLVIAVPSSDRIDESRRSSADPELTPQHTPQQTRQETIS